MDNAHLKLIACAIDWTNVIAAGSSVVTPLSIVPEKYAGSTKGVREYYHQIIAPASDIDLFIYGIDDEKAAVERMIAIERSITDNLLAETTAIRTKNCITIVSQWPNRHVQVCYNPLQQLLFPYARG